MTSSPGGATADRSDLEERLFRVLDRAAARFLRLVREDAAAALDAPVLLAAADPFSFTQVMKRWRFVIDQLSRQKDVPVPLDVLRPMLEAADLPQLAHARTAELLQQSRDQGWTAYRTKRELSAVLVPRQGDKSREWYRAHVRTIARTTATTYTARKTLEGIAAAKVPPWKRWVTRRDRHVRATHAQADGQTVPHDQEFMVGGWGLMYPGDPSAPAAETANCRCVIVEVPAPQLTAGAAMRRPVTLTRFSLTAAGGMVARWTGPIAVEGKLTGDSRMLARNSLRWENLPLVLAYCPVDNAEHNGAVSVGLITEITRVGDLIMAKGTIDLGSEYGAEAARLMGERIVRGVSVDLDDAVLEVRVRKELLDEQQAMMDAILNDGEMPEPPELEVDDDGMVTVVKSDPADEIYVTTDARIRSATLVRIPAFIDAELTLDEEPAESILEPVPVAAAAGPVRPPKAWTEDPGLPGPTPLRVTDDGRVYGHLATWDSCHIGFPGECVSPPRSPSGYAYFRTGTLMTAEGIEVPTGRLTMGTGHAGPRASYSEAMEHYDNTGAAVADVAAGEDAFGIWVAGAVRPGLSDEQLRTLRGSPMSGDWRTVRGQLELVAALAVNVPGFPIPHPTALAASGRIMSLTASGIVFNEDVLEESITAGGLTDAEVERVRQVLWQVRHDQARGLRARVNRARVDTMARKLRKERI